MADCGPLNQIEHIHKNAPSLLRPGVFHSVEEAVLTQQWLSVTMIAPPETPVVPDKFV